MDIRPDAEARIAGWDARVTVLAFMRDPSPQGESLARRPFRQDDAFRSRHVVDAVGTAHGIFYQLLETAGDRAEGNERTRSAIWRVDPVDGEAEEVAGWAADASAPTVSGDGGNLFFLAAHEGGRPQVYRLKLASAGLTKLTSVEAGVSSFAVSPDGKRIAFAATAAAPTGKPAGFTRIADLNYRYDPVPGYLQDAGQALHLLAVDGDGAPVAMTPFDGLIGTIAWSPDGNRLAYVVNGERGARRSAMCGTLYVSDLKGERRVILRDAMIANPLAWLRDGRRLALVRPPEDVIDRQCQLYLIDSETGNLEARTATVDRPVLPFFQPHNPAAIFGRLAIEDDRHALAAIGFGGRGTICRISLDGEEAVEPLVAGDCVQSVLAVSGNRLLFSRQDATHPSELWSRDLGSGEEKALTGHNAAWRKSVEWPALETVSVERGGDTIEGWVLLPGDRTGPVPAILYIHGGPHSAFGYHYCEDFHELVGAGYAVIFANPHGSTNYGDAFSTSIQGRWAEPEFADFMALLDELVSRGVVDGDRLGVTGFSGGGHLSAWLITHSDRFKAAVPEQGVYNMFSMYGVSDLGPELIAVDMGGKPHEQPERYWALSPIAHAGDCKTPTLLIQGEDDIRCPMEQAEQFFAALKIAGCEVELLRLRECRHGAHVIGAPSVRRLRMDAMKDWFDRHIPGERTPSRPNSE
jgi:dipeptidyl aminopeptidase/acylaminoacyl peptidase